MEWASISARDGVDILRRGGRALDVRSPLEFARGSLPGFANVPILNDEHRHQVGLTYNSQGQDAAIALGLSLVSPLRAELVRDWQAVLRENVSPLQRVLICWRGGLRSKMAATWLRESGMDGVRVAGGYKALRAEVLTAFETPPSLIVLGGLTGSGKTDLLKQLPAANALDLEALARHRGSSFGLNIGDAQPAQQSFENALGFSLLGAGLPKIVEAESRLIGRCVLPAPFKNKMDASPLVVLEASLRERARRIFVEYVEMPCGSFPQSEVALHLGSALKRTERRLGGLRYGHIRKLLEQAFEVSDQAPDFNRHALWIEAMLKEYYDPLYNHSSGASGGRVVFPR